MQIIFIICNFHGGINCYQYKQDVQMNLKQILKFLSYVYRLYTFNEIHLLKKTYVYICLYMFKIHNKKKLHKNEKMCNIFIIIFK